MNRCVEIIRVNVLYIFKADDKRNQNISQTCMTQYLYARLPVQILQVVNHPKKKNFF